MQLPLRNRNYILFVMTLQGRLVTSHLEALEQSSGMTLSRADLVLVW